MRATTWTTTWQALYVMGLPLAWVAVTIAAMGWGLWGLSPLLVVAWAVLAGLSVGSWFVAIGRTRGGVVFVASLFAGLGSAAAGLFMVAMMVLAMAMGGFAEGMLGFFAAGAGVALLGLLGLGHPIALHLLQERIRRDRAAAATVQPQPQFGAPAGQAYPPGQAAPNPWLESPPSPGQRRLTEVLRWAAVAVGLGYVLVALLRIYALTSPEAIEWGRRNAVSNPVQGVPDEGGIWASALLALVSAVIIALARSRRVLALGFLATLAFWMVATRVMDPPAQWHAGMGAPAPPRDQLTVTASNLWELAVVCSIAAPALVAALLTRKDIARLATRVRRQSTVSPERG